MHAFILNLIIGVKAGPDCPVINGDFCLWIAEDSAWRRVAATSRTML